MTSSPGTLRADEDALVELMIGALSARLVERRKASAAAG